MDSPVTAPPVVAVVVSCDPGAWFEETLRALAAQDYPNLSVLVLDAGTDEITPRVAKVLPSAFVRRVEGAAGFGAAVNEVLGVVEGASHFLVCHDDVAPDPDAVRLLVEEAFRSNAGIVSPKLVEWEEPRRLLQVGMSADKLATPVPLVELGELDQEQHDAVRDVFVAPAACLLVRADLFATIGGFDPVITAHGDDVDLSWRAQIVGARVVVAPAARVRHRVPGAHGLRASTDSSTDELRLRHALRTMFKCYGRWHLLRVVPQAVVVGIAQAVLAVATGRASSAGAVWRAWRWNARLRAERRLARRIVQRSRALHDGEVRRLQSRGLAGVRSFAQDHHLIGDEQTRLLEVATRGLRTGVRVTPGVMVALALTAVLVLGSRDVLFGRLTALGEIAPVDGSPFGLLRLFASGWRTVGIGGEGPQPPALALLGLLGAASLGAVALTYKLLILATIPLGLVGVHRLVRALGSDLPAVAATVAYAAVPLPYNALASGRVSGLAAYGVLPWVLRATLALGAIAPFAAPARRRRGMVAAALALALAAMASLAVVLAFVLTVLAFALGLALTRRRPTGVVVSGLAISAGAAVLLMPWAVTIIEPAAVVARFGAGEVIRFQTGPMGAGPLAIGLLVAAALPLFVAHHERLNLAAAAWMGIAASVAITWAAGRGWLPVLGATPEATLAPAALGVALAIGCGVRGFEVDLRDYHFGWRQAVSVAAGIAFALGSVPMLGWALDGRWDQPRRDFSTLLSWMAERRDEGGFRVLWLGEAGALPLGAWRLTSGLAYATSTDGPPDVTATWAGIAPGKTEALARAVRATLRRDTTDLGRLLSPLGVRYVVVARRPNPVGQGTDARRRPAPIEEALAQQVDLGRVESDDALALYENAAWTPTRAVLAAGAVVPRSDALALAARTELRGAPALLGRGPFRFSGDVPGSRTVLLAASPSPRWRLEVSGERAPRSTALGVANAFATGAGGRADLRYRTPPLQWLVLLAQVGAWMAAIAFVVRRPR